MTWLALVSLARAETCPADRPEWIGGRATVWQPNHDPAEVMGVGEIFVYEEDLLIVDVLRAQLQRTWTP